MNDVIRFPCPGCGKRLKAPAANVGRRAKCACGLTIRVPGSDPAPAPEPLDLDDAPPRAAGPVEAVARPGRRGRTAGPPPGLAVGGRGRGRPVPHADGRVCGRVLRLHPRPPSAAGPGRDRRRDRPENARPNPDPNSGQPGQWNRAGQGGPGATAERQLEGGRQDHRDAAAEATSELVAGCQRAAGRQRCRPPGRGRGRRPLHGDGRVQPADGREVSDDVPVRDQEPGRGDRPLRLPRDGANVGRRVRSDAGPVKLKGYVLITSKNNATGEFTIPIACEPESGSFPDGNYQTDIELGDTVVARLNWSVGGAAESTAKTDPPVKGGTGLAGLAGEWDGPLGTMKIGPDGKGTYSWLIVTGTLYSFVLGDLTVQEDAGKLTLKAAPQLGLEKVQLEFTVKPAADGTTLELTEKKGFFKVMTYKRKAAPPPTP